jgi:hypothetical protein
MALELRFKTIYTSLAADHFKGEICYDVCKEDFKKIVDLVETLLEHKKNEHDTGKAGFIFDNIFIASNGGGEFEIPASSDLAESNLFARISNAM